MEEVSNLAVLIICLFQFIFYKAIICTTPFQFSFISRSPKATAREGAEIISPSLFLRC